MGEVMSDRRGYRSLFWPIVLIAIGVIWLLGNTGIIGGANLMVLFRLWPLLLIVVGLDLLFGRHSSFLGAVIAIGAVALLVVLMLVGPSIGLAGPQSEIKLDSFREPRQDATSAAIQLDLSIADATITPLTDSTELFTADVAHVGDLTYRAEGETAKNIYLGQEETQSGFFEGPAFLGPLFGLDDQKLYWNIGLNPNVPLRLDINSGVGQGDFDLNGLQLQSLSIKGGVGNVNLQLPSTESAYEATINSGAGELNITIAEGAAVDLSIHGGVGAVNIDVSDQAAMRIEGSSGVGSIDVPPDFRQVSGDSESFVGDKGVWESANYGEAARKITIEYDGGVGSLTIK